MGYYIETDSPHNKADWLLKNAKASRTYQPNYIPVVVMDNGYFEAAGVAFDKREFDAFTNPSDRRPKTIVYVPRDEVIRLCPFVEPKLPLGSWHTPS